MSGERVSLASNSPLRETSAKLKKRNGEFSATPFAGTPRNAPQLNSLSLQDINFLIRPEIQNMLDECLPYLKNPLALAEKLSKKMSQEERRAFMHYLNILPKVREKFGFAENSSDFICDSFAFEQATAKDISQWKAGLWAEGATIADLCCGMGGDSFFLPESVCAVGVDIDEARVAMFNENMRRLGRNFRAKVGDALLYKNEFNENDKGADFFCIDPARRGNGIAKRGELKPSFDEVLELAKNYAGGMVKLPPAFPENEIPEECDVFYLGGANDCRECLVMIGDCFGRAFRPPKTALQNAKIHAVTISKDAVVEWCCYKTELKNVNLSVKNLGAFLFEPNPVLVRSHIFLAEAKKMGLWQIDGTLAYLSGDEVPSAKDFQSGFSAYKVVDSGGLSTSAVKSMLRKHNAGSLTLKKRGVEVVPEQEIKRLAPKGEREFTLFYTRILGEKKAVLAEKRIF